jgi:hypothetical protein
MNSGVNSTGTLSELENRGLRERIDCDAKQHHFVCFSYCFITMRLDLVAAARRMLTIRACHVTTRRVGHHAHDPSVLKLQECNGSTLLAASLLQWHGNRYIHPIF